MSKLGVPLFVTDGVNRAVGCPGDATEATHTMLDDEGTNSPIELVSANVTTGVAMGAHVDVSVNVDADKFDDTAEAKPEEDETEYAVKFESVNAQVTGNFVPSYVEYMGVEMTDTYGLGVDDCEIATEMENVDAEP